MNIADNLIFDDERVFRRLRVYDPSITKLVSECADAMRANSIINSSVEILQKVANDAARRETQDLTREDYGNTLSDYTRTIEEDKMHDPLKNIISFIEDFQDSCGTRKKHSRHFVTNEVRKFDEDMEYSHDQETEMDAFVLNGANAQFVCREPSAASEDDLWRHSVAFLEVKPSRKQGPRPSSIESGSSIVAQSAVSARHHMSARPFQIFSVGLLVFGDKFCVGIFDRGGVVFSRIHNMWQDFGIFIRVVRRISCDLSPHELGQDPTADRLLSGDPISRKINAFAKAVFPTYQVSFGGTDNSRWVTIGPPLWISVSLLGRGTSVWKVCPLDANGEINLDALCIMKSAWRNSKDVAESDIYQSTEASHPGLAKFDVGRDVCFPGMAGRVISVNELRTGATHEETHILHRIILSSLGRPLYDYSTEEILLKGVLAAIKGHRFLFSMGILHCDISIGNVFLSLEDDPKPEEEGFLADLDHARTAVTKYPLRNPLVDSRLLHQNEHISDPAFQGAMMTGTLQFMAVDILRTIVDKEAILQEVHHDLESFIWVLTYAVYHRLLRDKKVEGPEWTWFHAFFGKSEMHDILVARESLRPLRVLARAKTIPEAALSPAMRQLFLDLYRLLQDAHKDVNPDPLTYVSVITALERAIIAKID